MCALCNPAGEDYHVVCWVTGITAIPKKRALVTFIMSRNKIGRAAYRLEYQTGLQTSCIELRVNQFDSYLIKPPLNILLDTQTDMIMTRGLPTLLEIPER